jgi:hypothetical protein
MLNAVTEFLTQEDWPYEVASKEPTILTMGFAGNSGQWNCFLQLRTAQEQVVFYSICPFEVPEESRNSLMEFVTRANFGLVMGNFELNLIDGELRYKTSIDVEGESLTPKLVKSLIFANVFTMDRYLPGIQLVLQTDISPETAIRQVEG